MAAWRAAGGLSLRIGNGYLIRQLTPWHANIGKRQIKSPKIYWRDSGLLHHLLGITDEAALLGHPKCGASWEGFVLEQALAQLEPDEVYFWGTHGGAELDALMMLTFMQAVVGTPDDERNYGCAVA